MTLRIVRLEAVLAAWAALALLCPTTAWSHNYGSSFGSPGSADGQFWFPVDLVIASRNGTEYIYVVDIVSCRVQVFTTSGKYDRKWGSRGTGNGEFQSPIAISCCGDSVWVCDTEDNSVQEFSLSGELQRKYFGGYNGTGEGEFKGPVAVAFIGDCVYVVDWMNNRVQKFDGSGKYVAQWGSLVLLR